ncbi:hypothetical protein ACLOJK_003457 [Asimina triloba]
MDQFGLQSKATIVIVSIKAVALLALYDCGWCVFYQQLVSRSSGGLLQKESSMTNKLLDVADGAGGLEDENVQGMQV